MRNVIKILSFTVIYDPNGDSKYFEECSFKNFNRKFIAMTIDELRTFPNCGHYTDEQAENIVRTLDKLATIIFDYTCQQYGIVIDNQVDREEKEDENLKIAA